MRRKGVARDPLDLKSTRNPLTSRERLIPLSASHSISFAPLSLLSLTCMQNYCRDKTERDKATNTFIDFSILFLLYVSRTKKSGFGSFCLDLCIYRRGEWGQGPARYYYMEGYEPEWEMLLAFSSAD